MRRIAAILILALAPVLAVAIEQSPSPVAMPNASGSLKFAVIGGSGTGDAAQNALARQISQVRDRFPFGLILLAGGNIYGAQRPKDFQQKFEMPYQSLLTAGVVFRASLGDDDDPNQRFYKPFNMNGNTYYSFAVPGQSVRFFALETTRPDPKQMAWLEEELKKSADEWKVVYLHQPLYSSRGEADRKSRAMFEPLFVANNVSVVFSGGEHVYERLKPQRNIVHFVVGSSGKLDKGGVDRRSQALASGFDAEQAFLIAEIVGDQLTFNAISRSGTVIDSGTIARRRTN